MDLVCSASSGIHGFSVSTSNGAPSGGIAALAAGTYVDPIHQHIGTYSTPDQTTPDAYAGHTSDGGTTWIDGLDGNEIFEKNGDIVWIGSATTFSEIEVIMSSEATKQIGLTFQYSTGASTWSSVFNVDDDTDGFQRSGHISWAAGSLAGWSALGDPGVGDSAAGYWIKITRISGPDPGTPTPTTMKTGAIVLYKWDKDGNLAVNDVQAGTADLTGITDGNIPYMGGSGFADSPLSRTGTNTLQLNDRIDLTDGTDTAIIKHVQEPGLGGRLTLGLDETARTIVICDAGDVDTDFGLDVRNSPSLHLFSGSGGSQYTRQDYTGYHTWAVTGLNFVARADVPEHDFVSVKSTASIELTDTDGEQSWMYIEPKINQSATGSYNGLKINVTETALGDGSTGSGNNLILAGTSTDPDMFKVDNVGRIVLAESSDPAALADHAFLYAKDNAGTGEMYAADAAATATQLTSHNFSMFTPDPTEKFPWSFYAENKALGVKINVDMAGMVRAVEEMTGKKFIYYEDIAKSVDLEAAYKAQWEREYIQKNTYEEIVSKDQAFEMVEVDERVLYEVVDPKTGKIKKQGKKIGEKITGYELIDDVVKEKKEIIWETKKVQKAQLKANVRFDNTDGKFYKKIVPTKLMAETAAVDNFKFTPPAWMANRLNLK